MTTKIAPAFLRDGATVLRGLIDPPALARLRELYDWCLANPSVLATKALEGTPDEFFNDVANRRARPLLERALEGLCFGDLLGEVWGSENVWCFGEETFLKQGDQTGRTLWHQDSA